MPIKPMPRLKDVTAGRAPYTLRLTWDTGHTSAVNMTGVVFRNRFFEPIRNARAFRRVRVIDHGWAIGWDLPGSEKDADEIDYPGDALERLAAEQKPMTGRAFFRWQRTAGLSNQETADLLDVSVSTVKNYHSLKHIPKVVQVACSAMSQDPIILAAHYRPRISGRPRKTA